jgi:hypothetical protein
MPRLERACKGIDCTGFLAQYGTCSARDCKSFKRRNFKFKPAPILRISHEAAKVFAKTGQELAKLCLGKS